MLILIFAGGGPDVFSPVADFIGTPVSGSVPMVVMFTDLSTNVPTSWLWDFGDGSTSTLRDPMHTYTVAGTYTVSLTATNAAGSNTKTRISYITAMKNRDSAKRRRPQEGTGDGVWRGHRVQRDLEKERLDRQREIDIAIAVLVLEDAI